MDSPSGTSSTSERPAGWGRAIARRLLGDSPASAAIAALSLASLVAWSTCSAALRSELGSWAYRDFLLQSFALRPSFAALALPATVSAARVGAVVAYLLLCIGASVLAARAVGTRGSDASAIGVAAGLATAVVPSVLLATIGWPDGQGMLTTPVLLLATALATALAANWWWKERHRGRGHALAVEPRERREPLAWWAWCALAAAIVLAAAAWLQAVSDIRGFDSFGYHLPLAASWLRHGRLVTGAEEALNLFYPGNFELLVRWLLALGTDRFAFVASFASAVLALWVLYRICRELGQPRSVAAISALSATTLQVLVVQSTTVYGDTFTTLALLVAVWLLVRWWRDRGRDVRLVIAMGASLGIALGSKYSAAPPALVIALVFAWGVWRFGGRRDVLGLERLDGRWARRQLVALALPALAPSLYWYARNLVEHGNPLFPVSIAGLNGVRMRELIALRAELAEPGWRWLTYPWGEWGFVLGNEEGLGPLFASVALLGVIATPFVRRGERAPRLVVWTIALGSCALWLRSGLLVPRYGLLPLMLSFVFVGELWLAYGSLVLRGLTLACLLATSLVLSRSLLAGTAYVELLGVRRTGVPSLVDTLPPTTILNAAGQPSGYFAMGRDYRHSVVTLYRDATPRDVERLAPEYLLVPREREAPFTAALPMTLVARWKGPGVPETSLWRVAPSMTHRR